MKSAARLAWLSSFSSSTRAHSSPRTHVSLRASYGEKSINKYIKSIYKLIGYIVVQHIRPYNFCISHEMNTSELQSQATNTSHVISQSYIIAMNSMAMILLVYWFEPKGLNQGSCMP